MATKGIGLHEDRVRVVCHLPLNHRQEEKAVLLVLGYLKEQRKEAVGVKGFAHSELRPAVFRGFWWDKKKRDWVEDKIALCIIDYRLDFSDPRLSTKVEELKDTIKSCYRRCGLPQQEIWVVAHHVLRQD